MRSGGRARTIEMKRGGGRAVRGNTMGEQANHFTVAGDGIEGGLDTTSIAGVPVGSITVDGHEGSNFEFLSLIHISEPTRPY